MNIFKKLMVILFVWVLSSCVTQSPPLDISDLIHASTSTSSESTSRSRTSKSRSTRKNKSCANDDCEDICEDIYEDDDDSDGVIERCLDLNSRTIDSFETIIDYLSDPSLRNVRTVKEEYSDEFKDLVNVSLFPWIEIAEHSGSSKDAKALLTFVASSEVIAKAIEEASRNYEGFSKYEGIKELLDEIATKTSEKLKEDLGISPESPITTITIVIEGSSIMLTASEQLKCARYKQALCEKGISGTDTFNDIANEESEKARAMRDSILEACGYLEMNNDICEAALLR